MTKTLRKLFMGVAALGALALGGSAIAGAAGTSTTSSSPSSTESKGGTPGSGYGFPAGEQPGTAAHENAEKAVAGAEAEKAQAAAVASVAGKAGAVTRDFRNVGYEVTVTKTDGTQVPVHLDGSFKVETHPGGPGRPGAPDNGQMPPAGAAYGQEAQAG